MYQTRQHQIVAVGCTLLRSIHPINRPSSATSCHRGTLLKPYRQLFSCKPLSRAKAIFFEETSVGQGAVSDIIRQDLCGSSTCYWKCPSGFNSFGASDARPPRIFNLLRRVSARIHRCGAKDAGKQAISKSTLQLHPFGVHCHGGNARSGSGLSAFVQNIERTNTSSGRSCRDCRRTSFLSICCRAARLPDGMQSLQSIHQTTLCRFPARPLRIWFFTITSTVTRMTRCK